MLKGILKLNGCGQEDSADSADTEYEKYKEIELPPEGKYLLNFKYSFEGVGNSPPCGTNLRWRLGHPSGHTESIKTRCMDELVEVYNKGEIYKDLDKIWENPPNKAKEAGPELIKQSHEQFKNGLAFVPKSGGLWSNHIDDQTETWSLEWQPVMNIGYGERDGESFSRYYLTFSPDKDWWYVPIDVIDSKGRVRVIWVNSDSKLDGQGDDSKLYGFYPSLYAREVTYPSKEYGNERYGEIEIVYSNVFFKIDLKGQNHEIWPLFEDKLGISTSQPRDDTGTYATESELKLLQNMKNGLLEQKDLWEQDLIENNNYPQNNSFGPVAYTEWTESEL